MAVYTMNDAENFSVSMLDADIMAGYLGGPNAAGKPWTDPNWLACGSKPKLPIWVPAPAATWQEARSVDCWQILSAALHYRWPSGTVVAFDLETSKADYSYIAEMAACLEFFNGFGTLAYGSLSTITDAVPGGIWKWSASWDATPHLDMGFAIHATQWTNGPVFDRNLVDQVLYDRILWR